MPSNVIKRCGDCQECRSVMSHIAFCSSPLLPFSFSTLPSFHSPSPLFLPFYLLFISSNFQPHSLLICPSYFCLTLADRCSPHRDRTLQTRIFSRRISILTIYYIQMRCHPKMHIQMEKGPVT